HPPCRAGFGEGTHAPCTAAGKTSSDDFIVAIVRTFRADVLSNASNIVRCEGLPLLISLRDDSIPGKCAVHRLGFAPYADDPHWYSGLLNWNRKHPHVV